MFRSRCCGLVLCPRGWRDAKTGQTKLAERMGPPTCRCMPCILWFTYSFSQQAFLQQRLEWHKLTEVCAPLHCILVKGDTVNGCVCVYNVMRYTHTHTVADGGNDLEEKQIRFRDQEHKGWHLTVDLTNGPHTPALLPQGSVISGRLAGKVTQGRREDASKSVTARESFTTMWFVWSHRPTHRRS